MVSIYYKPLQKSAVKGLIIVPYFAHISYNLLTKYFCSTFFKSGKSGFSPKNF